MWISVKERLPELFKDVLVYGDSYYNNGERRYYVARYADELSGWSIPGMSGLTISHWQPLPPPPEEGK